MSSQERRAFEERVQAENAMQEAAGAAPLDLAELRTKIEGARRAGHRDEPRGRSVELVTVERALWSGRSESKRPLNRERSCAGVAPSAIDANLTLTLTLTRRRPDRGHARPAEGPQRARRPRARERARGDLYLPVSPCISLYLHIPPYISLYLPISPSRSRACAW